MTSPEPRTSRHLSLLEVAVVLIVIAALSLFAIPQVQSRRILVHEESARELLRQIHDAEQQFFLANDGKTYGFLPEILGGEVAGRADVNVKPRVLAASGLKSMGFAHLKDGYLFMIVLPGRGVPGVTHENRANLDSDRVHRGYLAYAWPMMSGYSGRLLYVIDEQGVLRQYRNDREPPFSGLASPPPPNLGARKGDAFGGPAPQFREYKFDLVPQ